MAHWIRIMEVELTPKKIFEFLCCGWKWEVYKGKTAKLL